ncbi:MAG: cation diffusion facilitator family transporter [Betaproteobacteria bacterium]
MHPHHHSGAEAHGHRKADAAIAVRAHAHSHTATSPDGAARRALVIALALTASFGVVEAVGGWIAGSLALLADAGHMFTDAAALGLALFAHWVARRPPSHRASYGYARAEVLAAFVNALALLGLVAFIVIEAVHRLLAPQPVAGTTVLVIGTAGLVVNLVSAWVLSRAGGSLNVRGALLHVMSDVLGSLAAVIAGAVIVLAGWTPIDPLLSLVVSVLIVRSTWRLLAQSTGVLMEGVPAHLDYEEIGRALTRVDGIAAVHDLHVWQVTSERAALSAHVLVREPAKWPQTLAAAQRVLAERFRIDHVTLQPDWHQPPAGKRVIALMPIASGGETHLH